MKTTLQLPDELVKEIKLRAVMEGKKLKDAVAELLRKGLDAKSGLPITPLKADQSMLKRRAELTQKFVSGEWGVELAGYETSEKLDRTAASRRAKAWRK